MRKYYQVLPLLGLFLLGNLIALFLSTPGNIFTPRIYFSADPDIATDTVLPVNTKFNINDDAELEKIPLLINGLQGTSTDNVPVKERLNATSLLVREYVSEDLTHSAFLVIAQSNSKSSMHPPPACYKAQGYEIADEEVIYVQLADTEWMEQTQFEYEDLPEWAKNVLSDSSLKGMVPVNKMVAVKKDHGDVTERRIILYFYLMDISASNNWFNLVRTSSIAPVQGDYEAALTNASDLMGQVIPLLFSPYNRSNEQSLGEKMIEFGWIGYILIVAITAIPVTMIVYPVYRTLADRRTGQGHVRDQHNETAGTGDKPN